MITDSVRQDSPLVLVVDDDKSMRMLLRLALEQLGYQVVEAADGEACLAAYKKYQPDAILIDAMMPGMDGFACCSQLRALSSSDLPYDSHHIPILMITVLDDLDSVEQAFEVGASDYITKPIQWAVLRHRLRRLLRESERARYVQSLVQQIHLANQEVKRLASELALHQKTDLQ